LVSSSATEPGSPGMTRFRRMRASGVVKIPPQRPHRALHRHPPRPEQVVPDHWNERIGRLRILDA